MMMFIVRERLGPREGNGVYIRAQTGFEGSQEARALDKEVAITSTPSSVRLVSGLCIERVDGIESRDSSWSPSWRANIRAE